ncbi:hypothetical protein TG4357_01676 [Thalassovita gelatinovora]|uniref:Uncharacterized protein n=1 Tax=Thalassovita gelatinovora TaxID=53501 RepID=A0A0P1FA19_THAGE|nr:hypothetical protein TG4357_01676 [Thalassovita gelatinovora]
MISNDAVKGDDVFTVMLALAALLFCTVALPPPSDAVRSEVVLVWPPVAVPRVTLTLMSQLAPVETDPPE